MYIISVRPELVDRFLHLNGFTFVGTTLSITRWSLDSPQAMVISPTGPDPARGISGQSITNGNIQLDSTQQGVDTRAYLKEVLRKRYNSDLKLLDLSALRVDPDLQQLGVYANPATASKFFPVLMKLCDEVWNTPEKKIDAVQSVVASNNQLASVLDITTLAATFPSLRNLDLSNNLIPNFEGLKFWRWKFRDLEHLIISNNPIQDLPDFRTTILKWYPKLIRLDGIEVRTSEEVQKQSNPIPVAPPFFRDEAEICAKFVTSFFPLFDTDRISALRNFYDNSSQFSVSVNTNAKRVQTDRNHSSNWDQYIKRSRNLLKITHLPTRQSRLFCGTNIQKAWENMPRTKHPDLNQKQNEWLMECHPLPGLPDPQNQSPSGVGGLIIMVHGSFDEIDTQSGKITDRRSFDRTFVLGPSTTAGSIRVISDVLVLRDPGGCEAWSLGNSSSNTIVPPSSLSNGFNITNSAFPTNPTSTSTGAPAPPSSLPALPNQPHPEIPPGSAIGQPAPNKSDVQLQQEILAINLSFKTAMRLDWAAKCLLENGWDLDKALVNFQSLVASNAGAIPQEAFLLDVKR